MLLVVATLVVTTSLTHQVAAEVEDRPFRDGSWAGTLSASGIVDGAFPDATATMNTTMDGTFNATVFDGEVTSGVWTLDGGSDGVISAEFGTGNVSNVFHGSGPVGGDAQALELGGRVQTTWQLDIGGYTDTSEDPIDLGPFTVEVFHLDCDTLLARFDDAFQQQVEAAGGWTTALAGTLQARHLGDDPSAGLVELFDGVLEDAAALSGAAAASAAQDPGSVSDELRSRMRSVVALGLSVEAQIAELGGEASCLFPAHAEYFGQIVTVSVQQAAAALLRAGELDADSLEFLAETLLAVGGAGLSAAPGETLAGELDELIAARASQILDAAALTDPAERAEAGCADDGACLPADPEVVQALRAAELLYVDVTIAGETWGFADIHTWLVLFEIEQMT